MTSQASRIEKQRNKQIFNEKKCTRCGVCFHKCPELNLQIDIAKQEINALIDGSGSKYVLSKCSTCFSCNIYCPYDCKPYELILENWNTLYNKRGAPPIYRFVCPTMDNNIWQMLFVFMPDEEKNMVLEWMTPIEKRSNKKVSEILLIGSYTHLFPFIIGNSKLLDYFIPIDALDNWEVGGYLYQGGYLDVVKKIGEHSKQDFIKWNKNTVVTFLDAVEYMINTIQPKEMGVDFPLHAISFNKWLLENIKNGKITLSNPLNLKVTVHDNCYSKTGKELNWDPPREILDLVGCTITEMEHIRDNSLCCGFGKGASWTRNISIPFDILRSTLKKFKEAEATGAEALISYCTGCLYLLWAAKELFQSKIKVFHLVEIVRMAMGEEIDLTQSQHVIRAWDIIAIITYHLMASIFHRSFKIEKIIFDPNRNEIIPWKKKRFILLKIIRYLLKYRLIQALYKILFKFMMKIF